MIAVVIGVLAVLVIAAIIWARVSAARSENKSVETYEHALGVLGQVSKRTESTGFRILPHEETGRAHVGRRIDPAGGEATEPRDGPAPRTRGPQPPQAPRRLPPAGEPKLRFSSPSRPAGPAPDGPDDQETGVVPATGPVVGDEAPARARVPSTGGGHPHRTTYKSAVDRRRQVMTRRAATAAAAAVAVIAVVVAGIYLTSSGGHPKALGSTTTTTKTRRHHGGGGGQGTTTTTTTTTVSTGLRPISTSPVTFAVPSGAYTLAFQASGGPCWVGIEHTSAGPWLYASTLSAGQAATFKGSGTLIVDLGAPSHFGLTVNGLTADLPTGVTQAYSFDLTPAST